MSFGIPVSYKLCVYSDNLPFKISFGGNLIASWNVYTSNVFSTLESVIFLNGREDVGKDDVLTPATWAHILHPALHFVFQASINFFNFLTNTIIFI